VWGGGGGAGGGQEKLEVTHAFYPNMAAMVREGKEEGIPSEALQSLSVVIMRGER
jgi:hypothetical protein